MSELPLALAFYADLDLGKLCTSDGNTLILPDGKLGDTWLCKQRFLVHTDDGVRERDLNVRSIRASIGNVMTPPTDGTFKVVGEAPAAATVTISTGDAGPLTFIKTVHVEYTSPIPPTVLVNTSVASGTFADMAASIAALQALATDEADYTITAHMDGSITVTAGAELITPHHLIVTFKNIDDGTTTFEADSGALGAKSTPAIPFDATAPAFKSVVQEVIQVEIAEVKKPTDGVWLYRLADDSHYDLTVGVNRLDPVSFVRIRAWQGSADEWWHEVRLIQAPLSFSSGHERVLPTAPVITQIQDGRVGTDVDPARNEIQALYISPDFRGTFFINWDSRRSALIGLPTGPDEIAAALNAMYTDGKTRFVGSLPEDNFVYFEFIGDLAATSQALATVTVDKHPPGVVTFSLPLDRAELASALRTVTDVTVPLEVEVEYVADGEDPEDEDVASRILTLFQTPVKLVREQIYAELGVAEPTDWLNPPSPKTYLPFNGSQLLVGNQATYKEAFGNGTLKTFVITHNRGTRDGVLSVRENASPFKQLEPWDESGRRYTVNFTSTNVITLTFNAALAAPTTNQYVMNFTASGPASAFQSDLHIAIPNVDDLEAALASVTSRLDDLEDFIPTAAPSVTDPDSSALVYAIPSKYEAFPGKFADPFASVPTPPLRAKALLPALHVADGSVLASDSVYPPLPAPNVASGHVYQNDQGEDILIPGSHGQHSAVVPDEGYFGADLRLLYPVTKDGANHSYYPTSFERRLFALAINDKMLRAGWTLTVTFDLAVRLMAANTAAQWVLVIQTGTVPQVAVPSPVGVNLSDVVWNSTPILKQRLVLGDLIETGSFGASVSRSATSVYTAAALLYTQWEAANSGAPASANFFVRAMLEQFDTEDGVLAPVGAVWYGLTNGSWKLTKN